MKTSIYKLYTTLETSSLCRIHLVRAILSFIVWCIYSNKRRPSQNQPAVSHSSLAQQATCFLKCERLVPMTHTETFCSWQLLTPALLWKAQLDPKVSRMLLKLPTRPTNMFLKSSNQEMVGKLINVRASLTSMSQSDKVSADSEQMAEEAADKTHPSPTNTMTLHNTTRLSNTTRQW